MEKEEKANGLPEKKFRAGAVCATVWSNSGRSKDNRDYTFKSISIERRYKDKNDQWQSARSFNANDLPKLRLVLDKAYEYLVLNKAQGSPLGEGPLEKVEEEMVM